MKDFDDDVETDVDGSVAVEDIDENSFSTDDEEEEEIEKTVAVVEGASTAEQYKEILLKEEEEFEKVTGVLLGEDDIEKKCREYDNFIKHITGHNLHYQDITPMFVDGTPILIDATSLVTCIMEDTNYCVDNGGQTLHFIYLCERIIELISRKGGTCEIVFFRDKSAVLQAVPDFFLALSILKIHLMKNTSVIVHEMDTIFSSEFKCYIDEVHPCFIILDFSFIDSFKEYLSDEETNYAKKLFHYYKLFALSVGLYCVDICHVELYNNMLYSFVTMYYMKNLYRVMCKDFLRFSELCVEKFSCLNSEASSSVSDNSIVFRNEQTNTNKDVRKFIALETAKILIKNDTKFFIKNEDLVKAYLFYNAVLESLPLSCRCFDSVKKFSGDVPLVIKKVVQCIGVCLKVSDFSNLDCSQIADLWHGNLFIDVIWCIKCVIDKVSIGNKLKTSYSELIKQFNDETGHKLQDFPIFPNNIKEKLNEINESDSSDLDNDEIEKNISDLKIICAKDLRKPLPNEVKEKIIGANQLMQPLSDMIKNFCSDILPAYYTCNLSEYFKHINKVNKGYEEKYHWHCIKPLTDDFDRIKDSNKENAGLPMKRQLKLKAQYAHYMALYGSNIEGKPLEHEPIVVCDTQKEAGSKKKQKKQGKTTASKKTIELIEKNKMKKQKELLELEKQKFETFVKIYKTNKTGRLGDSKNLEIVNQVLLSINSDEYTGKILFYKMEVLFQLWVDMCRRREGDKDIDVSNLKELFLVIRQLLHCSVKIKSLLTDKQNQKLGKILCSIGFRSIAEKWNLPLDSEQSSISSCKLSCIRFQLGHLGPELERKIEGQVDERVTGFIPDPWQKKLFDIVDKGQSALIVAPTSSGKTYASYYCMKKVLKESNEGRVVYVAPTKALVNQVAATIYARFKNKNMPAGMSVYGVFTRDYKYNSMECQILVTVPECLELLLMSPRRYGWVKSLRYVIFDEIHCLAGQGGGITWERCLMLIQCPFLALSATIQNPREFWTWMQSIETFKKSLNSNIGTQVHLVVHSDRHNDLIRHIYGQDFRLHHIHPYAYLSERVLLVHNGVPSHISLAPSETVELYDTMISVCPDDASLLDLDPDKYFANTTTGFICRQDVKEYENKLRNVLEKWFKEKRSKFTKTINKLYEPLSSHESGTKNFKYFKENIVPFIDTLRSKNMLPAIVFSYNRGYCEVMGEDLGSYYRKKEDEYMSQRKRPLLQLQNYDEDDNVGNDDDDERSSKGKKRPSAGKKDERMKRDVSELFPLGLTKCNIEFSLRGKARVDSKDLQFIEKRLNRKFNKNNNEINQLRRGLGVHHGGITTVLRQSVEMLFRSKFLNVVFATGTLALGIHMPCKTVVIMGDSPYLNTLEYHQMSGRSGRRGFDKTGDVIFFGLDTDKMRVLMTSKLPRMSGNFPLTVTAVLRLLVLIKDVTENSKKTDESYNATLNRVLTVLNEGLLYQTEKKLKDQMKHFVLFSCQLLMIQRLIDSSCQPMKMAGLATHLHYHEPGNLALIYLLRSGTLVEMCKFTPEGKVSPEACELVMNLLSRLFTRILLKTNKDGEIEKKLCNSVVKLPPLPDYVVEALENYNKEVKIVYRHYFEGFSQHINETMGEDNKLPISGKVFEGSYKVDELCLPDNDQKPTVEMILAGRSKHNLICSAFAGLSGQTDDNLYCQDSLISNIRHQVFTDCKIIPIVDLETPLNGYAYDFYRHGILRSIIEDNGLRSGQDWVHLLDFLLVLKAIETSLDELGMTYSGINLENGLDKNNLNRCVSETFSQVRKNYEFLFNNAYHIRERY